MCGGCSRGWRCGRLRPSRMNSGARPSFQSDNAIAGVISARAKSVCGFWYAKLPGCSPLFDSLCWHYPHQVSGSSESALSLLSPPRVKYAACELPGCKDARRIIRQRKGPPRNRRKSRQASHGGGRRHGGSLTCRKRIEDVAPSTSPPPGFPVSSFESPSDVRLPLVIERVFQAVADALVRFYRTVSAFSSRRGSLFSVALIVGSPPPSRWHLALEPGLSSRLVARDRHAGV